VGIASGGLLRLAEGIDVNLFAAMAGEVWFPGSIFSSFLTGSANVRRLGIERPQAWLVGAEPSGCTGPVLRLNRLARNSPGGGDAAICRGERALTGTGDRVTISCRGPLL